MNASCVLSGCSQTIKISREEIGDRVQVDVGNRDTRCWWILEIGSDRIRSHRRHFCRIHLAADFGPPHYDINSLHIPTASEVVSFIIRLQPLKYVWRVWHRSRAHHHFDVRSASHASMASWCEEIQEITRSAEVSQGSQTYSETKTSRR